MGRRVHYAKILESLKRKKLLSLTPLRFDLKSLIWALRDSACALVALLLKKARMRCLCSMMETAAEAR